MLQNCNLTCLFLNLLSHTCCHLMLRILLIALWWKILSCFLFLVDRFHDSQPHRAAFIAKVEQILYLVLISTIFVVLKRNVLRFLVWICTVYAVDCRSFSDTITQLSTVLHHNIYYIIYNKTLSRFRFFYDQANQAQTKLSVSSFLVSRTLKNRRCRSKVTVRSF